MTGTTTKNFKNYNTAYIRIQRHLKKYTAQDVREMEIKKILKKGLKSLTYGYIAAFATLLPISEDDWRIFRALRESNANIHAMRKAFINRYLAGVKI